MSLHGIHNMLVSNHHSHRFTIFFLPDIDMAAVRTARDELVAGSKKAHSFHRLRISVAGISLRLAKARQCLSLDGPRMLADAHISLKQVDELVVVGDEQLAPVRISQPCDMNVSRADEMARAEGVHGLV